MSLESRELALLTSTALRKTAAAINTGTLAIVAKVHARPTNFLCIFPCFIYLIKQKKYTSKREKLFRQRIAVLWSIAHAHFADGIIIAACKGRVY